MILIQDHIAPLKGESKWGYTPAYFLSARFNLHRNYAEYYLKKGDLANRDINHILARFDRKKTTVFDKKYADKMYEEYKNNQISDKEDRDRLKKILEGKEVLLIAPGSSTKTYQKEIHSYIEKKEPVVISVNFIPEFFHVDYVFFSNNKRYYKQDTINYKTIVTSNLIEGKQIIE